MKWNHTNIIYQNPYPPNNSCPKVDVMPSYVEVLRRLGKLEPHEWKCLNVTNVSYICLT